MADEQNAIFKVNGKEYPMPTELTLGEMCDAEQQFGVEFGNQSTSGIRMVSAMLWIAIRREDPTVTAADIKDLPADVFANFAEEPDTRPLDSEESSNGLSELSGASLNDGSGVPEGDPSAIGTLS